MALKIRWSHLLEYQVVPSGRKSQPEGGPFEVKTGTLIEKQRVRADVEAISLPLPGPNARRVADPTAGMENVTMPRPFVRGLYKLVPSLVVLLAACSDALPVPPPVVDAGNADSGPLDAALDAARRDAFACPDFDGDGYGAPPCGDDCDDHDSSRYPGATEVCDLDDEDCNDTTYGADFDGDGFESALCCNGPGNCGADCDDSLSTVNPTAAESCNGLDDDCDANIDEAVCVDECTLAPPCGTGTCTDTFTGYTCACDAGYSGPVGGPCLDLDECAGGLGDCGPLADCVNTPGSFSCVCNTGYAGSGHGAGSCTDVDECASPATCARSLGNGCANTIGGYTCSCTAGFVPSDPGVPAACVNVDECSGGGAGGAGRNPCDSGVWASGGVNTCTDTVGGYTCACGVGFMATGSGLTASCADIDECATAVHDCSPFASCSNDVGGFTCACGPGFIGGGHGASGCLWNDPSLSGLTVGAGATLGPALAAGTTWYAVTLPADGTSTTLTPTVAQPAHATITVDGVVVASGASAVVAPYPHFSPRGVILVVTTESGATRTYHVAIVRGSTYVKASNTGGTTAFDPRTGDQFGWSLSLSPDGTRLAVGAPREDSAATGIDGDQTSNAAADSGAVYVFARTGATWAQEAYLKASNAEAGDRFGQAVSLSSDGTRLVVGAPGEASNAVGINGDQADNSAGGSGAAYMFSRTGTTWTQTLYVKASNTEFRDGFGSSVAISKNGLHFVVGAPFEDSSGLGIGGSPGDNTAYNSGAAYVFNVNTLTSVWSQVRYIKASNTGGGVEFGASGTGGDEFGSSVAISTDNADGFRLAIGAHQEDSSATGINGDQTSDAGTYSGAVYVIFKPVAGPWTMEAYVKASNTGLDDQFGSALALSPDGAQLAVGAPREDSAAMGVGGDQASNAQSDSGAVYVFRRSGTTWTQEAYVKDWHGPGGGFGASVSLSIDGTRLAAGAPNDQSSGAGVGASLPTPGGSSGRGAVDVFTWSGTAWVPNAFIKASNPNSMNAFGSVVSISGERMAVGDPTEWSNATGINGDQTNTSLPDAGAVYVY